MGYGDDLISRLERHKQDQVLLVEWIDHQIRMWRRKWNRAEPSTPDAYEAAVSIDAFQQVRQRITGDRLVETL